MEWWEGPLTVEDGGGYVKVSATQGKPKSIFVLSYQEALTLREAIDSILSEKNGEARDS